MLLLEYCWLKTMCWVTESEYSPCIWHCSTPEDVCYNCICLRAKGGERDNVKSWEESRYIAKEVNMLISCICMTVCNIPCPLKAHGLVAINRVCVSPSSQEFFNADNHRRVVVLWFLFLTMLHEIIWCWPIGISGKFII